MDIQQQQIEGLQIAVNGGIIYANAFSSANENIDIFDLGGGKYEITEKTIGGIPLAIDGNVFLLDKQTNEAQNGMYNCVEWNGVNFLIRRSASYLTYDGIMGNNGVGTMVLIYDGDTDGSVYKMTTTQPFQIDVTPITVEYLQNGIESLDSRVSSLEEEIDGGEF